MLILALAIFLLDRTNLLKEPKTIFANLLRKPRENIYQKMIVPIDELEQVKKEMFSLKAKVLELEEENVQARRLLEAGIKPTTAIILGKVVGLSDSEMLVVTGDKETAKGAFVITEKLLVGIVYESAGKLAKIQLLSSFDLKLPVKIWQSEILAKTDGLPLAEGILSSREGKVWIKDIMASAKLREDDVVGAISGNGDIFLVGKIKEIFPSKDKVFQEVEIEWIMDPKKLITVGIVK